ncbi:MAG: hypothetical protein HYV29_02235 [Ignavibacteriales bacterium]|nr:hypothetical protein [Ignavibacteriales bacterium]
MSDDLLLFSEAHLHMQLETAPFTQGFYTVRFYTTMDGLLSKTKTDTISEFYLYPSGGTLRDMNFNLVFYDSQFDTYRGFVPPHLKRKK